jgi:hypothetical protein
MIRGGWSRVSCNRERRSGLAQTAWCLLLLVASPAHAQEEEAGVTARDREAAAEAYDRGTSAFLARDYERAAQWFETAHRLAPAAAALVEAARAHERGENALRAASIGLQLEALYPSDRAAARMAQRVLRNARQFFRVDVACEGCTIQVDGALMGHMSFFVEPDEDHVVEAAFEHGSQRETVRGAAGEQRSVSFTAPPAPVVTDPDAPPPDPEPPPPPRDMGPNVVPMPVTIAAIGLTAIAGAVLIWSGVDALDGVPAYEMNPTPEGLADGQMRETRTNVMIGVTSGLAIATVLLAVFTDWGGGAASEAAPAVSLSIQPDGAYAGLRGRF